MPPPLVAIAPDPSAHLRPLAQLVQERANHVYVLPEDATAETLERRMPDLVIFTGPGGERLAAAIRSRFGDRPRLVAIYPDAGGDAPPYDERVGEPLCARTLSALIQGGRSGPEPESDGEA